MAARIVTQLHMVLCSAHCCEHSVQHSVQHSVLTHFTEKSSKTHFYTHQKISKLTNSNRTEIYYHLH